MKKFLQKSCHWLVMLIAMFAMSVNSMAKTVVFDKSSPTSQDNVTVSFSAYGGTYGLCNLYGTNSGTMSISSAIDKITKIEMTCAKYGQNTPSYEWASSVLEWDGTYEEGCTNAANMTFSGGVATWQGTPAKVVKFGASEDIDIISITVTTEDGGVVTYMGIDHVTPAEGNVSAKEGLQYITVYMSENFTNTYSTYWNHPIPDGVVLTDGVNNYTISSFSSMANSNQLNINVNKITTPGTYTLTIPEGFNVGESGISPAMQFTWTIEPLTTFEFERNGIEATGVSGNYNVMKSLAGFKVAIPEGVTLADVPANVSINVSVDNAEATAVTCAVAQADGYLTFTFPAAYNKKCSVRVEVPAESFTTTDGLKSEAFSTSFSVDPTNYFELAADAIACEGPVSSFNITLPEGMIAKTVGESFSISYWQDGNHDNTVSVTSHSQSGNVLTINFAEEALPYDVWVSFEFAQGFVITTDGSISSRKNVNNNKITTPVVPATFDYASPATGTISLDERPNGLSYFQIFFKEKLIESFGTYSGQTIPADFTLTDPNGVAQAFSYVQGWATDDYTTYKNFSISTVESLKTPGTYTLHVPADIFTFEGGKKNPELNLQWTLTAKTTFEFNNYGIQATGEGEGYTKKSLTGFKVAVPEGVTLVDVPASVSVNVAVDNEEATAVTCEVAQADGYLTFTFPAAYSEKCSVRVEVPAESFTTTDGLKSKAFSGSFSVDPTNYYDITVTPGDGDTVEGPLTTLAVTIPENITVTGLATGKINFGGWQVEPETWNQEGNVVTLVFPADKAGQIGNTSFWYSISQGLFLTEDGMDTNSTLYAYSISIVEPTPDFETTVTTLNLNNWNVTYNGSSTQPTNSAHFNNGDVFAKDKVTMTLTNIPSSQNWPNECFYSNPSGNEKAVYLCNGEGFTIAAPAGCKITKIVVKGYSSYPLTSLIINGVQNTTSNDATWTGIAESVNFSTISGDATKRVLIQSIEVTHSILEPSYATVTSVSPAVGEISLDENPDGLHYFSINFEEKLVESFGTYSGQNLPEGFSFTDPNGNDITLDYLQGWESNENYDYKYISFASTEALKTPGDYTFHFPAGIFQFEDGKVNPALDYVWTLKAAQYFSIGYYDYAGYGEAGDYGFKRLDGFNITAPSGVTFASISNDAKVQTRTWDNENQEYVYADVAATITIVDGKVNIALDESITTKGSYSFYLSAGAIVAEDGKTSKEYSFSANVDPTSYFSISVASPLVQEGPVSSLDLTLSKDVTVTSVGNFTANGNTVVVTNFTQNGTKLTINFADDAFPYDTWITLAFSEGFAEAEDGSISSSMWSYNHMVTTPVVYMTVEKLVFDAYNGDPVVSGATVDKLSSFYIYFNEPLLVSAGEDEEGNVWTKPEGMTLTDGNGQTYGWSYVYGYAGGRYNSNNSVVLAKLTDINYEPLKAAGTYTLHIPAGAYTSADGHPSQEINYTFIIEDKVIKLASAQIDETEGGMGSATITFDNEVLVTSNYPAEGDVTLYKGNEVVTLEDLSYVYLSAANKMVYVYVYSNGGTSFLPLEAGDYALRIAGSYFKSVTGSAYSEADYIEIPFTVTTPAPLAVGAESNGKYVATYYDGKHNWIVPEGVTAYVVNEVSDSDVVLTEAAAEGEVVNSNVAVILVSESAIASAPLKYTIEYGSNFDGNLLRGVTQDQLIQNNSWGDQYTFYMLSKKDGNVGFYWDPSTEDEGASINAKAHKAYLRVPVETAAESNLRISFGGETTSIDAIATEAAENIFNLQGQRVVAPVKGGVYVKNGKKIIVK